MGKIKGIDTTKGEDKKNWINSTGGKKKHVSNQKQEAEASRKIPDPRKYPDPGTEETEAAEEEAEMTTTKDS